MKKVIKEKQSERKQESKQSSKEHNHIFEQLSMYKGEQSNDSRKKKEMKLKKKTQKTQNHNILKWKKNKKKVERKE